MQRAAYCERLQQALDAALIVSEQLKERWQRRYGGDADQRRIRLDMTYGKVCSKIERIRVVKTLIANDKIIFAEAQEPVPTTATESQQFEDKDGDDCLLTMIPDLALMVVLEHLHSERDIKALCAVLPKPLSIEIECYQRMRQCLDSRELMSEFWTTCDPREPCRRPTMCLTCYLHGYGQCLQCLQSVELGANEPFNVMRCDQQIKADTGTVGVCRELLHCPTCAYSYFDTDDNVLRMRDFACKCAPIDQPGCVNCTRECTRCANIGCCNKEHFRVNKWNGNNTRFPRCDDCQYPHCCKIQYTSKVDNVKYVDWDYLICPRLPPLPEDMEAYETKRKIIRPRQPHRKPNGPDQSDCGCAPHEAASHQ